MVFYRALLTPFSSAGFWVARAGVAFKANRAGLAGSGNREICFGNGTQIAVIPSHFGFDEILKIRKNWNLGAERRRIVADFPTLEKPQADARP